MNDSAAARPLPAAVPDGDAAPTVIEARGVTLSFGADDAPVYALQDIDLSVKRGEFVSLIGPSGCGKTTLMRVVADLATPSAGSVSVNGMTPSQARLARAYGYVFQAPVLYAWRNAARNVELPLEIMGLPAQERRERSRKYLAMVGLESFARKFPWQLSGGMQQRVSIARALAFDPDLLLMDEPFGALDEITRDHLNEHLLELWHKTRKTVIFVTHSIAEAVFLSTRIVVMSARPGRIVTTIDNPIPTARRKVAIRDTEEFLAIAHRVREALRAGHSYDD